MLAFSYWRKFLALLILFQVHNPCKAARTIQNVRIIITSFEYRLVPDSPLKLECTVSPGKYDSFVINANGVFSEDINDVKLKSKFYYVRNGKRYSYLNADLNLCEELLRVQNNIFLRAGTAAFLQCTNAPFHCPFKKNFAYAAKNYSFYDTPLPSYIPQVDVVLLSELWLKDKFAMNMTVRGRFIKTKAEKRTVAPKC